MNKKKLSLLLMLLYTGSIIFTGCWNYREIDMLAVVAGVGIDKGDDERYKMTVEIAEFTGERQSIPVGKTITLEGETIFDTARNGISYLGQKLYWSHTKVVIISERLAEEGLISVLDWFNRDAETRGDVNILVSKGVKPKEILEASSERSGVKSFEMGTMMRNQKSLAKAPKVEIWHVINDLSAKGVSAVVPTVNLEKVDGGMIPKVSGTAIFKHDKLIGYLDGEETKTMLFVQNEIKGGLLVQIEEAGGRAMPISLEIFKSKTKIKPVVKDDNIEFNINVETTVAIDELAGIENYIQEEDKRKELQAAAEEKLKTQIQQLINKVQNQFGVDIFGFGEKLKQNEPKLWKSIENDWNQQFKNVSVKVNTKINIRNSSMLSKPLDVGE